MRLPCHAMAGDSKVLGCLAKDFTDHTRMIGHPSKPGHIAISGHTAFRNAYDNVVNCLFDLVNIHLHAHKVKKNM